MKQWRKWLPGLGAELLEVMTRLYVRPLSSVTSYRFSPSVLVQEPSTAATHLLTSPDAEAFTSRRKMPQAYVVSVAWLEACLAVSKLVPESDYLLRLPDHSESQSSDESTCLTYGLCAL